MILYHLFYDDFARFFLAIDKNYNNKCKVFSCINLSGFLYLTLRMQPAAFSTIQSLFYSTKSKLSKDEISYVTAYYEGAYTWRAHQLYNYYKCLIKRNSIEYVIISGDSRLSSRILKILCVELNITHYFFEQGPYGTTVIDPEGVNANCSFRNAFKNIDLSSFSNVSNLKYKRNITYRFMDHLLDIIIAQKLEICDNYFNVKFSAMLRKAKRNLHKFSLTNEGSFNFKNKSKNIEIDDSDYILYIAQVPSDANMILHSPLYSSHSQILHDLASVNIKNKIRVREHPLFIGMYEDEFYDIISNCSFMEIDNSVNLNDQIKKAKICLVNNSTVGIQSLILGKNVVALGDSYYDQHANVHKVIVRNTLNKVINCACEISIISNGCDQDFFLKGHFRDENINLVAKSVADYLKWE